ncbi:hypothetical protein MPF19_06220 [Polaribacter sp. Z014]|uniref:hypothetical protein n=1 Tax=Polaribacter sp. Z014 TaxID=2927126 RepID=UPI0020215003|nr:hypothetical protein [Polaribacter sp. Z014]MCL7763008.1 hypothetical protein [Polaribacter sp. Z014]
MNSKVEELKEKRVLLKAFPTIKQIDNAIKHICQLKIDGIQISVLGKLEDVNLETNFANYWTELKTYCNDELRLTSNFGVVSTPKIGAVFIAGFLAPMFLQEINGKKIGAMTTGLYGILRGIGVAEESVIEYKKSIKEGNYLLIIRGNKNELPVVEANL